MAAPLELTIGGCDQHRTTVPCREPMHVFGNDVVRCDMWSGVYDNQAAVACCTADGAVVDLEAHGVGHGEGGEAIGRGWGYVARK